MSSPTPSKKFLKAAAEIEAQLLYQKGETKKEASHDESNWLVSYADMMTLLCGFFIMLFSMAKMDPPQYEKVREAMQKQFGKGEFQSPTKDMEKLVTQVLNEQGVAKDTSVKIEGSGVTVAFQSTLFFDTLSAEIRPEARELVAKLSQSLLAKEKKDGKFHQIVVEGHTDSRPIIGGQFVSNWELSGARASRVVRFFLEQGFKPDHLTAIGYGDTRPEAPSRSPSGEYDEAALAKNRRVVLRILDPKADSIPMPGAAPERAPAAQAVPAPVQAAPKAAAPVTAPAAVAPVTPSKAN